MFCLRSCHYSPLNLRLVPPLARSLFFAKPSSLLRSVSLPSSRPPPPNRRGMSSKPSAFDALMSGARNVAAAAARKKSLPPSPKKRKSSDASPVENPSDGLKPDSASVEAEVDRSGTIAGGNQLIEVKGSNPEECPGQKKAKQSEGNEKNGKNGSSSAERVKELKSKIHLLKKKPADFSPKSVACWGEGERVPFIFLCLAFDLISNETGRIVITDIVRNVLRTVMDTTPDDLVAVVYLLANRIAPAHEGLELGIGDASIVKALAEAYGRTEVQIRKQYKVIF